MRKEFSAKFDGVNKRFDGVENSQKGVKSRMDGFNGRFDGLREEMKENQRETLGLLIPIRKDITSIKSDVRQLLRGSAEFVPVENYVRNLFMALKSHGIPLKDREIFSEK